MNMAAVEVSCIAKGARRCQFICAAPNKMEALVRFFLAGQEREHEFESLSTLTFFHPRKDGERRGWFVGDEV